MTLLAFLSSGCVDTARSRTWYRGREAVHPLVPEAEVRQSFEGGSLTLERATRVALSNNPDMQIALERIRQSDAGRREVSAVFLPFFSADFSYLRADAPSVFLFKSIDSRTFQAGTDFNNPDTFDNFESGLSARYNLFNGGRDLLDRRIAQTDEEISRLSGNTLENALVANVVFAYYDVLMAGAMLETATASVETVRAQLRETEANWREGRVLKSDVLSLEVRLAEAEEQRIRAENGRRLVVAALANLLGLDAATELELAGGEWTGGAVPGEYEEGLREALLQRPELEQARRMVERAGLEDSRAKRAFLPRVDAEARTYWDDPDLAFSGDRTNWLVGVGLSWNLFEGGRRFARTKRSEAVFREMQGADRKQVLAVQLDVKRAYLKLEEARARVAVTEASVAQAEETLSLVRTQYEQGTATVTRYLEAELALTRARMRSTNALFDVRKATGDVARALGRFSGPKDAN